MTVYTGPVQVNVGPTKTPFVVAAASGAASLTAVTAEPLAAASDAGPGGRDILSLAHAVTGPAS
jgi:hypothetical protein